VLNLKEEGMPKTIAHRDEYIRYFDGAINQQVLHKVPSWPRRRTRR